MCEMLGLRQRLWLRNRLAASKAPLKIIASGSVLAGSVGYADVSSSAVCSGDDWMCWLSAQQNFLHTLANATTGQTRELRTNHTPCMPCFWVAAAEAL